jgi:hypothetical protein
VKQAAKARIAGYLSSDEDVIADASVRSLAAITNQSARSVRLVLTGRRILLLEQNMWTGGVTTKVALDPISLEEITALEGVTKHPVATLGVPVFVVRLALGHDSGLTLGSSGFQNRRFRVFTDRLAQLRPGLPTVEEYTST